MRLYHADLSDKDWYAGPWNADLNIAIGYANTGIDEPHLHRKITEIYLVARGTAEIRVEQTSIALKAGDMLVVEAGEAHAFLSTSRDYFHFVIHTPGLAENAARASKVPVAYERLGIRVLKAFVYAVRQNGERHELLASVCHHEPGFEVPKGSLKVGETPEQGALRELYEETGIEHPTIIKRFGATVYQDELQYFLLFSAPDGLPDHFAYRVVSPDSDNGLVYDYHWLPVTPDLRHQLVQGCDYFVDHLLDEYRGL